jgi:hypothetical protein
MRVFHLFLTVSISFVCAIGELQAQASNSFPKTGAVGIGTTQPKGNLDARGVSYLEQLVLGQPTSPTTALFQLTLPDTYNDSTAFVISSNKRRLFQVGSTGIVRAREIIVDNSSNWPDYVFADNYRLVPYDELRSYIIKYRHLPNIPSALQVEQDGIPLGEMNRLLLEKIEELTLYILEQEERIRRLEENQK